MWNFPAERPICATSPTEPLALALMAVLVLGPGLQASAHHGSDPHFDPDDPVTLTGTVTELRFVNPHSFLHFVVAGVDGETVEWRCEMGGATRLGRSGWTSETLTPGESVTVSGPRARREEHSCAARSIILANGTDIGGGARIDGTEAQARVADARDAERRPRYLDNGQPNLSGPWILRQGGGMGGGFPEHTEAGRLAAEAYDGRFDNPVIRCESGNIILDWTRQSHVNDIGQDDNRVTIRYGYLDLLRTVHLDATSHPEKPTSSIAGHSIGWWEDDVLVVDTVGFMERVLIPRIPLMTSDRMRVVERFAYDEETRTLTRDYVVTDPLYLSEPLRGRDVSDIAAEPYRPFNCVDLSGENNRRPTE